MNRLAKVRKKKKTNEFTSSLLPQGKVLCRNSQL